MTLEATWLSGHHVGDRRPVQNVRLRRGVMDRKYAPFMHLDGSRPIPFGFIQDGKHNAAPWHADWRWTEDDWRDLPNVQQVEINQAFDGNGGLTATIHVENVVAKAYNGLVGTYHLIQRGYLSPLLGFAVAQRVALRRNWSSQANEWLNVLNGGYMVHVEQGYGDDVTPAFRGLIDQDDIDVNPDSITITCRDFNQFLTDQRIFGNNKAREILPPVIFADRLKADNTKPVGFGPSASSAMKGHPASAVLKPGTDRYWLSQGVDESTDEVWVEISLPAGRYTSYWLYQWGQGPAMDVALNVSNATINGEAVADGWVDRGLGAANDGTPVIQRFARTSHGGRERQLGFEVVCRSARLRIYYRNLPYWPVTKSRVIGVARLAGYLRKRKPEAKQKHWILTDDSSDVVKWCLMWAGFHEWEVESSGVRLAKNLVFHQSDFLQQPIKFMTDQGAFVFFMKPPTTHPDSIGVPVFRYSHATDENARALAQVTDHDILTDAQPKWSKESLSYIIRCRGKVTRENQPGGVPLGEDRTRRVQAVYLPPWSGAHHNVKSGLYDHGPGFTDRLSGLYKHRVIYDEGVKTVNEALRMCVLAAIQEALASYTMTIEVPGNPLLTLDEHISIIDEASGVNSRLWLANVQSTFTTGQELEYKVSLGGALVDTPDMDLVLEDHRNVREMGRVEP